MTVDTVVEQEVTNEAPAAKRKATPLTDAQKQAATKRREAALLRKHGAVNIADKLEQEADALAPIRAAKPTRVDPMTELTPGERDFLQQKYFQCTKAGLEKIAAVVSYKKLAELASGNE